MRSVYEASNSVEAHMMLNLLQAEGIGGRVDGDLLQGGMGELQAIGLICVQVSDADYDSALSIVHEWESSQPKKQTQSNRPSHPRAITVFALFVLIGIAALLFLLSKAS